MSQPRIARIYHGTPANLARLARRLRAGELVGVPTETVYGLAANALDAAACRRIFAAKDRPASDPLIVHIAELRDLEKVAMPNAAALRLAKKFWPGPLTLVLPKTAAIPKAVSAGLPSVAVRMPAHPLFRRLIKLAGIPLAAPSANPFGYVSPTTALHVQQSLGQRISHILDGGASSIGLESTIVDLRNPAKPRLLRPGAITHAQLERALGVKVARPPRPSRRAAKKIAAQLAPGLLARHYSPRTPVVLHQKIQPTQAATEAWLYLAKPAAALRGKTVFWLDARGDLRGAARRLFATLRRLDESGFTKIHAELAHGEGIADAINDRLRRAAAK